MSDREIRLLERAVEEGDELAREPLLRARVRAGLVSQERLNLAAALGDELARRVGGRARYAQEWQEWGGSALVDRRTLEEDPGFLSLSRDEVVGLACDWAEAALLAWEAQFVEDRRTRKILAALKGGAVAAAVRDSLDATRCAVAWGYDRAGDSAASLYYAALAAQAEAHETRISAATGAMVRARVSGSVRPDDQRLAVIRVALSTPP